ncbi:MAG: DNA polymerase ligase N-terminal domain-containing protein [Planctomycetaceae bacterium]
MPQFVILEHDWPELHYDFMLEHEGVLLTWRLPLLPELDQPSEFSAERIFDHRLHYLTYQGSVSGGRGAVRRRMQGSYSWLVPPTSDAQDDVDCWEIEATADDGQSACITCANAAGLMRFFVRPI